MKKRRTLRTNRNRWSKDEEKILLNAVNKSVVLVQGFEKASQILGRSAKACSGHFYREMNLNKAKLQTSQIDTSFSASAKREPFGPKDYFKEDCPVTIKNGQSVVKITKSAITITFSE